VYIAAPIGDRELADDIRTKLENININVTSAWMDKGPKPTPGLEEMVRWERYNREAILGSEILVVAVTNPNASTGGMHSEMGYALACIEHGISKIRRVYYVSKIKPANVMAYHPNVLTIIDDDCANQLVSELDGTK